MGWWLKPKQNMKRKRRKSRLQKRKENRMFPFSENTTLAEFIKPKFRNKLHELMNRLKPFLINGLPDDVLKTTRLDFNWKHPQCSPTRVCMEFAIFFVSTGGNIADTLGVDKNGRRWRIIELIRYLVSAEHGNFRLSERSLKALIDKEMRDFVNTL